MPGGVELFGHQMPPSLKLQPGKKDAEVLTSHEFRRGLPGSQLLCFCFFPQITKKQSRSFGSEVAVEPKAFQAVPEMAEGTLHRGISLK